MGVWDDEMVIFFPGTVIVAVVVPWLGQLRASVRFWVEFSESRVSENKWNGFTVGDV